MPGPWCLIWHLRCLHFQLTPFHFLRFCLPSEPPACLHSPHSLLTLVAQPANQSLLSTVLSPVQSLNCSQEDQHLECKCDLITFFSVLIPAGTIWMVSYRVHDWELNHTCYAATSGQSLHLRQPTLHPCCLLLLLLSWAPSLRKLFAYTVLFKWKYSPLGSTFSTPTLNFEIPNHSGFHSHPQLETAYV